MKRILKIVGIATLISALLVVSIGGVVSAAPETATKAQTKTQSQDCTCECICECLDGECTCLIACGEAGPHEVKVVNGYIKQNRVKNQKGQPIEP